MNTVAMSISGRTGKITLEISRYERPDARLVSDKNWLAGNVQINVGPFSAAYEARFETYDFASFYGEVKNMLETLNGTAHFQCTEECLTLTISIGSRGEATIRGVAKSLESLGTSLNFSFDSDQSYLGRVLDSLGNLCDQFPVLL